MKKRAVLQSVFCVLFLSVSVLMGTEIHVSSLVRGSTPPPELRTSGGGSLAKERALLLHQAEVDTSGLSPAGVVGRYSQTFGDDEIEVHHIEVSREGAQFLHLVPHGDGPVRVTMSWEDESRELDARMVSASSVS
ncbi:hypothetical protein, partial [Chitinivibrio alkaliphilus]|uniref:hypothetical protein n=1 Tax=Chitinivibrio alkaliphilus TaxID=1505232 RepID=UPI000551414E